MKRLLLHANVITPQRILADGCVALDGATIAAVYPGSDGVDLSGWEVTDLRGKYLAPGFVDIHVHGGGGGEFNLATPEEVQAICTAHARFGTTSIVPTTLAAPLPDLYATIDAVRAAQSMTTSCNILGIHLEGPYFAQSQRGAQNPEHIILPRPEEYVPLLDHWSEIRMVGAAPEIAGALALGDALHQRGIVASIAHSDATYDDVLRAIDHGYQDVTHIYSGCSMVHRVQGYRVAGVVEAGLLLNELTVQVIADGKHLPSALLQLVVKCKGADGIALITDALFAAASTYVDGDVVRQANGVEAVLEDGVMKLMDRQAFAGSVATMDRLVRTMMEMAGVSLVDAVRMASTTPARIVGFGHCKGRIAPGYDADLVVLDGDLRVLDTIVMGRSNKQDADVCHREAK